DGLAGLRIGRVDEGRVPPHPALALAPGVALEVRGGAVVHHAAVRGPRPAPLQVGARYARRIGLAPRREVLIPRREAAAVDPRRARGRAVVLQLAEALEMLLRLGRLIAVDLPQHLARAELPGVQRLLARVRVEVPRELVPSFVPRQ